MRSVCRDPGSTRLAPLRRRAVRKALIAPADIEIRQHIGSGRIRGLPPRVLDLNGVGRREREGGRPFAPLVAAKPAAPKSASGRMPPSYGASSIHSADSIDEPYRTLRDHVQARVWSVIVSCQICVAAEHWRTQTRLAVITSPGPTP